MEENTNLGMEEMSADQQDSFLEGWGDESPETEEAADQQTEQAEGQAQEEAGEDTPTADESAAADGQEAKTAPETKGEEAGEDPDQSKQEQEAALTWTVKHMGQEKTMGAADVTPELLQKGLDYDRIRGKYDEAKPVMEMFTEFAKQAGMSVTDYVKFIRAEAKKAGGMSEAEAKRAVELEDREAAVSAKEAAQKEENDAKQAGEDKVKSDLAEFERAFPDVYKQAKSDPKAIPESVWKDVNSGLSLTAAYARHAVAQAAAREQTAKEQAAAASQNQKNQQRSTGSMKSAGNDAKNTDAFLDAFGS